MKKPLLSHLIIGRNDNYLGNFKQRLEMAINYTCRNIERSGNLDAYELLICDWNSDTPLRQALNLNEAALVCTSLLEVPPNMVSKLGLGSRNLHLACAFNVAARRAQGEFIMLTPADVIFPYQSVRALFALLRGETEFPADIRRCYMGIERFLIPWQASERLSLGDLDRYLLLHSPSIMMERRFHGVAAGEGASLMPRQLWHDLRGINESYAAWGYHDIDLGRRAAQSVPLLKASLAGVFCYDFQQRPQLRLGLECNTNRASLRPEVNDANWGLALEDIPKFKAEACPQVNNIVQPPRPYDIDVTQTVYSFKQKLAVLARQTEAWLFKQLAQLTARHWVASKNNKPNSKWFCGEWFGEAAQLQSFLARLSIKPAKNPWPIRLIPFALAVLATVGRQRPTRFFHAAARDTWVAQCAVFVDSTLEITGYDHWQGAENLSTTIHGALGLSGFQGYYHLLTGPLETAFKRLKNTPFAGEPYNCLALDLKFLSPISNKLPSEISPLLADSCAIILGGGLEARAEFGAALAKESFQAVGTLPGVSILARGTS